MTASYIAKALNGRKGSSGWMAHCPAHDDKSSSLSVKDSGDKILVHCFAGCDQGVVINALRDLGLWPESERKEWTEAERKAWGAKQREQEEAELWGRSALALSEIMLERYGFEPERRVYTELINTIRRGGIDLLTEYREWKTNTPGLTKAMARAGRDSERRAREITEALIDKLAAGGEQDLSNFGLDDY